MGEIWKPVPSYPLYEVSNLGRARSWNHPNRLIERRANPLQLKTSTWGSKEYQLICVSKGNASRHFSLSRTILTAFIGPPPTSKHEAAHGDGNISNNQLGNLRWATPKENTADKWLHGTMRNGSQMHASKLSEKKVIAIRRLSRTGMVGAQIAKKYNVARNTIYDIVHRRTWAHV